jgi:two-component system, NtrC family, nitrogen regulation sensor histidine kinase NtrY
MSMLLLLFICFTFITLNSFYDFKNKFENYNYERLQRKEKAIQEHIDYVLKSSKIPVNSQNIPIIFENKIFEISDIHGIQLVFYDTNGKLLKSAKPILKKSKINNKISKEIIDSIQTNFNKTHIQKIRIDSLIVLKSYSLVYDFNSNPIAILKLPYINQNKDYKTEFNDFFKSSIKIYLFLFILTIIIAFILSKYISEPLEDIAEKLTHTTLGKENQKIISNPKTKEIALLVESYNAMVDKLEESAEKLAQTERENAWREMAKQVAHEIKNPLTPMRLNVQDFERKFNINDPNILEKLEKFTKTMLTQIDTMTAVSNAFSHFASLPAQENTSINFVEVVKLALNIFSQEYIHFYTEKESIITKIDRTQLVRIITNLVKNAIQAIPENHQNPRIDVRIFIQKDHILLAVKDNGIGIDEKIKNNIFEPKFTTKTNGMGLGLAMIKNIVESYNGTITCESKIGEGAVFLVDIPIITENNI